MLLYLADITDQERALPVDPLFSGEIFTGGTVLKGYDLTLRHYRATETIALTIAGPFSVTGPCDRCGEELEITVDMQEQFILMPAYKDPDYEYPYEGETIEIDPFVHEAIVLNIPQKIVCDESCKGLCPVCGANRNRADCDCTDNN